MDAQLKKGVMELVVLSQLQEKDQYGYLLTETISKQLFTGPATLYLVLKRLKDNGDVETYLKDTGLGPARKYYRLTTQGRNHLAEMKEEWYAFVKKVGELIQ